MNQAMAPDPYTTSREDWTRFLTSQKCPIDATPAWRHMFTAHQRLLDLLAHNPAMARNLRQTYMKPAASKNKVYFMWDFVGRTLAMIMVMDPANPSDRLWEEVLSRVVYTQILIRDTTGKLETMNRSVGYNDDGNVCFGDEIMRVADSLTQSFNSEQEQFLK